MLVRSYKIIRVKSQNWFIIDEGNNKADLYGSYGWKSRILFKIFYNRQMLPPFFVYSNDVRKVIYAIESLNMILRKAIKTKPAFPKYD